MSLTPERIAEIHADASREYGRMIGKEMLIELCALALECLRLRKVLADAPVVEVGPRGIIQRIGLRFQRVRIVVDSGTAGALEGA
jgi:hypothetical protein